MSEQFRAFLTYITSTTYIKVTVTSVATLRSLLVSSCNDFSVRSGRKINREKESGRLFFQKANQQSHQESIVWKSTKALRSPQHPATVVIRAQSSSQNEYGIFFNTVVSLKKK